jgi:hypothetical protein
MTETPNELMRWAFHMEPQVEQDGESWTASYPAFDWSVSAPSREEALQRLRDEFARRQNAGEIAPDYADAVYLRHLREPIPGIYAMDNEVFLQLRDEPWTTHRRAFKEAEEKRRLGQPYTIADYFQSRDD